MFGYVEGNYSILKSHSHPYADGFIQCELRRCGQDTPYIAVNTIDGQSNIDFLFIYSSEHHALKDWDLVTGKICFDLNGLNYLERIENHCTGFLSDGSLATMY